MATQAQLVSGYRSMDGEGELARSTELFVPREDGGAYVCGNVSSRPAV